jgi:hypothetical protein
MQVNDLIILTICLFVFYFLLTKTKEGLDAVMVTNAFSDLRCIDDNLPIVRLIDNKSVQCLSKSQGNTQDCMMRGDLAIPNDVKCNDINTYLVKEIRNKNSPVRTVYDKLERDVDYNLLTCNPDGLNNTSHWCGKIYDNIKKEKCTSNEGKFGVWVNPCKQMPEYAALPPAGSSLLTTNRAEILQARAEAKLDSDISRNKALCGGTQPCRDELTTGSGRGGVQCIFKNEGDGNVSIFDKRTNTKVWESKTSGKGVSPYKVVLNLDGNMVLQDKDSKTIWESGARGTSNSRLYRANLLDKSGKCVLEITDKDGKFVWSS